MTDSPDNGQRDNTDARSAEYDRLVKPSEGNAAAFYSSTEGDIYGTILMKYMGAGGHNHSEAKPEAAHGADH